VLRAATTPRAPPDCHLHHHAPRTTQSLFQNYERKWFMILRTSTLHCYCVGCIYYDM
jgi:hypothetical protein